MTNKTCQISGETFIVSEQEKKLRNKFGFGDTLPTTKPCYRIQHLGAFWQHWNLHKRTCDKTGKNIISVFRPDCPYPIWHKDEWQKNANPPSQTFDPNTSFFDQAWNLFQKSAIPHNIGLGNENCEYTDDWWYSKNCYLCHSGYQCEDLQYCYRIFESNDSQFCVFSSKMELCSDTVLSEQCFESTYLLNCKQVQNSAFLYDCRNCSDCMFCFNLRNKQYCFGNQQLTKEQYEQKKSEWDLSSRKKFDQATDFFKDMMRTQAWHRSQFNNNCEASASGNYQENNKNCRNCFLISESEDCINCVRAVKNNHDNLDCICGAIETELLYQCALAQDKCYNNRFCFHLSQSKNIDYSGSLERCEHCFGCCGLVGKKYCIFNKQYTKEEYKTLVPKIIEHMKQTGEWGQFFPAYFAPNPYNESLSGFHFPLSKEEQEAQGYRYAPNLERASIKTAEVTDIPDSVTELTPEKEAWLIKQVFWDETFQRPFTIRKQDITFCKKTNTPLPNNYYVNRIQELFRWMPFDGELRSTTCGKSGKSIQTSWPKEYDGRILCEDEYQKVIH